MMSASENRLIDLNKNRFLTSIRSLIETTLTQVYLVNPIKIFINTNV